MERKVITITVDQDLLDKLEDYQNLKRTNRSQAIRTAILLLLKSEGIDL
jgi:metal-responsive CopG/Arc/MetJ family transcriptional regulator